MLNNPVWPIVYPQLGLGRKWFVPFPVSLAGSETLSAWCSVIYWLSTEPSIKRCTCVNKRKNSESRWTLENNITRCPGGSSQLETECQSENQWQTEGFGPLVTPGWATLAKMRKKCCSGQEKNLGQYSSPSLSPLISHTQQTSPFRK